jgi:hypothetical protein
LCERARELVLGLARDVVDAGHAFGRSPADFAGGALGDRLAREDLAERRAAQAPRCSRSRSACRTRAAPWCAALGGSATVALLVGAACDDHVRVAAFDGGAAASVTAYPAQAHARVTVMPSTEAGSEVGTISRPTFGAVGGRMTPPQMMASISRGLSSASARGRRPRPRQGDGVDLGSGGELDEGVRRPPTTTTRRPL